MTGHGQPQTCSQPINAQTLTEVCQAVRMFSPCQFQVYVSIGTLVSDTVYIHEIVSIGVLISTIMLYHLPFTCIMR